MMPASALMNALTSSSTLRRRLVFGGLVVMALAAGAWLWTVQEHPAVFMPFDGGAGIQADPWQIATAEQFVAIDSDDAYLDDSFVLTDDIDFQDVHHEGFVGLGSSSRRFAGSFDGDGHTVENFSPQVDQRSRIGLFRYSEGTIEAMEMNGVDIDAEHSRSIGSIVGINRGDVIDVQVRGDVQGEKNVGGLIGANYGEAAAVKTSVHTGGENDVGGLVGRNSKGAEVVNAKASGDVDGHKRVGGLVGFNQSDITQGEANGDVDGHKGVGGLAGANGGDGRVVKAEASGDVDGHKRVGGLIGTTTGEVKEGTASGDVYGEKRVGGFVGDTYRAEVMTAEASGDVYGEKRVGGFVGMNEGTITYATASGDVYGEKRVGGFVGTHDPGDSIGRSYSIGAVDGNRNVGGFSGMLEWQLFDRRVEDRDAIIDCYWNSDAAGVDDSAGGVGLTDDEFADPERFEGFAFCPGEGCRWVMDESKGRPALEKFAE